MNTEVYPDKTSQDLAAWLRDARRQTLALIGDLSDEQMLGQPLAIANPILWEIGHVAWFQEKWVLRRQGQPSLRANADALYDSAAVPHDVRWDLPLLARQKTLAYMQAVLDKALERLEKPVAEEDRYFVKLAVFHEDMHTEALTYTRQTLGYPLPDLDVGPAPETDCGLLPGDVELPGGSYLLGATPEEPFVFDNEKWAHAVEIRPFRMARAPVTQAEFLDFVEAEGYGKRKYWTPDGWQWREAAKAVCPVYWRQDPAHGWQRRDFDRWVALEPHRPMMHVNWHEAAAYCVWAGRRLPTEAEWEYTAAGLSKRRFPWGNESPTPARANLDWRARGCLEVGACGEGDSPFGCRQMIGNVWEWTSTDFLPYPGFVIDPYKEYSQPWFGDHKVLRGGAWATRSRLLRNTWRNFYKPDRRDIWAGFRTCAL
ncbi:MAG: selenoneine synthase SenA [Gemmataceae bacterium]